mgnify:CR=1 FL=1
MENELSMTFDIFFDAVKSYIDDDKELEVIKKAYEFANDKHYEQKRLNGEDYL